MTDEQNEQLNETIRSGFEEIAIAIENTFRPMVDLYEADFHARWNQQKKKGDK